MQIDFEIEGMMCQHCKASVENSFRIAIGVTAVEVELEKGIAHITFNEQETNIEELRKTLEDTNYQIKH